jgi:hypothetical protein
LGEEGGGGMARGLGDLGGSGTTSKATPSGEAKAGAVTTSGLDVAEARKVVARGRNQLRYCYAQQLATDPAVAGTLELSLSVDAGTVADAVATSEALPADLLRCVERSAKRWRFAGDGTVALPVTFTPGE